MSSNSPTTLSAPATPRPAQPPIMTMIPVRNDTTMMTPPPPVPAFPYPEDASQSYCEFNYHTGFQQGIVHAQVMDDDGWHYLIISLSGRFSDISVSFPVQGRTYALHRIIMARSPMLYRQMMVPTTAAGYHHVDLLNINIPGSSEALHTALGHLYQPLSMHGIEYIILHTQSNQPTARRVCDLIQISDALELPLLHRQLIQIVQQHLSQDTIFSWMNELLRRYHPLGSLSSQNGQKRSAKWMHVMDEIVTSFLIYTLPRQVLQTHGHGPNHHWQHQQDASEEEEEWANGGNGAAAVVATTPFFLGNNRINMIQGSKKDMTLSSDYNEFVRMYAKIPLLYLKRCLEHKDFLSKNVLWRYAFAKRVLYERECKQPRRVATPSPRALSVMLVFDNSSKNTTDNQSSTGIRIMMQQ